MAIRVSSSLDQSQTQQTKCWTWSIFPLIIWIRILGVNLPEIQNSFTKFYRWLLLVYGCFCFSSHLAGQIDIFCYLKNKLRQGCFESSSGINFETSTATWNSIIDFGNYAVHGIGTHVIMLTVIRNRWINLVEIFRRSENIFTDENYIRIRKIATFGVAYIILLILGLIFSSTSHHWFMGISTAHRIFISFMSTISTIYPLTAIVVFLIHCHVSSLLFESLRSEIQRTEIILMNGRDQDVCELLIAFKRRHIVACDTVEGINHCFGWTLFLSVTFFFVSIINSSFYLFGLDNIVTLPDGVFSAFAVIHLTLLCLMADRIESKAEDVIKELLRLKCDEPLKGSQKQLINSLISEMTQTIPQISANHYFNVSKKLFPQVIGTTLSYYFILFQFEASEKNVSPD